MFAYTELNHNSVVGIRELAQIHGAGVACIDDGFKVISKYHVANKSQACSLFAIPAECNFSGIRPCLSSLNEIRSGRLLSELGNRWAFLIDASKYCATAKLDLTVVDADFTVISFYKMFGVRLFSFRELAQR